MKDQSPPTGRDFGPTIPAPIPAPEAKKMIRRAQRMLVALVVIAVVTLIGVAALLWRG